MNKSNEYYSKIKVMFILGCLLTLITVGLLLNQTYPHYKGNYLIVIISVLLITTFFIRENIKYTFHKFLYKVNNQLEKSINLDKFMFIEDYDSSPRVNYIPILNITICLVMNIILIRFSNIQQSITGLYLLFIIDIFLYVTVITFMLLFKSFKICYYFKQQFEFKVVEQSYEQKDYKEIYTSFVKDLWLHFFQVILNIIILMSILFFCS